jgi:hypothetical protein
MLTDAPLKRYVPYHTKATEGGTRAENVRLQSGSKRGCWSGNRRTLVFSPAPKSLPQSSDCSCNGIRVVLMRGLQVSGFYKCADHLMGGFRPRSSIDFGHWHSASIN